MKKLILLLAINLVISCKKEPNNINQKDSINSVGPPVHVPSSENKGGVVFYFPSKTGNYNYGNIEVFVDNISVGKITMMPSGFVPTCKTLGWGIHCKKEIGLYSWRVAVTNSSNNYNKAGTFAVTEKSCESINVSQ